MTTMQRRPCLRWTAAVVIVPMLEMDIKPDLSWLLGTTAVGTQGKYAVQQAFQQFKLRANEKGARVKVVTGLLVASARATSPPPMPYYLDDPFIGFFSPAGQSDTLPLAAFWADTDVWQNPRRYARRAVRMVALSFDPALAEQLIRTARPIVAIGV